jgi:hypothetical protein
MFFALVLAPGVSLANKMKDIQNSQNQGEIAIEGGPGLAMSPFGLGFNVGGSGGFKINSTFSLLGELEYHTYSGPKTNSGISWINDIKGLSVIQLCFVGKFKFTEMEVRPFILAGPGVAITLLNDSTEVSGTTYPGVGASEVDLMVEGGGGLEFRIDDRMTWFVQGKVCVDLASGAISSSMPIYIPVQAGLDFLM